MPLQIFKTKPVKVQQKEHASSFFVLDLRQTSPQPEEKNEYGFKKQFLSHFLLIFQELTLVNFLKPIAAPIYRFTSDLKLGARFKSIIYGQREGFAKLYLPFKNLPLGWQRTLISFVLIALIFSLPVQALTLYGSLDKTRERLVSQGSSGLKFLKSGVEEAALFNLNKASDNFDKANERFFQARQDIDKINFLIQGLVKILPRVREKFLTAQKLVSLGELISEGAKNLSQGLAILETDSDLTAKINFFKKQVFLALPKLNLAVKILENLANDYKKLPQEIKEVPQETFLTAVRTLRLAYSSLERFKESPDLFLNILGAERSRRLLFVFLNNNEIRPAGGFIGSFALVDISKGKIKSLEVPAGGSYVLQGGLREYLIAPKPLHLINFRWEFQDANWFPDFPTSAQKIAWFYEKAGGPSVDGVIALTSSGMADILKVLGPIDMPSYGRVVDSDNFIEETQKIVELEYDRKENKPKQFIADLTPKVLERIFALEGNRLPQLLEILSNLTVQKHLLIYLKDNRFQKSIIQAGWAGEIKDSNGYNDFLMLVNANIAGQKTDGVIKNTIDHKSNVLPDGTIVNTVKITRTHTGFKGELFKGVRNVDYLRLYVPLGSVLLEARGFAPPSKELFEKPEIYYKEDAFLRRIEGPMTFDEKSGTAVNNEFGKTVFGNWVMVDPQSSATVVLRYKLPFKLNCSRSKCEAKTYGLLVQKQAGALNTELKSVINFGRDWRVAKLHPEDLKAQGSAVYINANLDFDKFFGAVLKPR